MASPPPSARGTAGGCWINMGGKGPLQRLRERDQDRELSCEWIQASISAAARGFENRNP